MMELTVPRLADRRDDVQLLVRHFLSQFSKQFGKEVRMLTPRAQIALARHDWPGNVRELENVVGHACMMTDNSTIDVTNLPAYILEATQSAEIESSSVSNDGTVGFSTLENQERATVF